MEDKQRQQVNKPSHKHPEQKEQDPDQRSRGNRPGEANIDQDDHRPGQQSERHGKRGDSEPVEGEGEAETTAAANRAAHTVDVSGSCARPFRASALMKSLIRATKSSSI